MTFTIFISTDITDDIYHFVGVVVGHDRIVVVLTTKYAISAYHH
jgi:hypothetical protein